MADKRRSNEYFSFSNGSKLTLIDFNCFDILTEYNIDIPFNIAKILRS